MTKKQHVSILHARVAAERSVVQEKVDKEIRDIKSIMADVVPKLIAVSIDRGLSMDRYRLVVDFDPFIIRDAFMWGNDEKALQYFCEAAGHQIYRELRTMNMHRFSTEMRSNPRLAPRYPGY